MWTNIIVFIMATVLTISMTNAIPRPRSRSLANFLPKETFIITDVRLDNPAPRQRTAPFQRTGQHLRTAPLQRTGYTSEQDIIIPRASEKNNILPVKRSPRCAGDIPDPGGCRAAFPRYYYNKKTDQCDCFLYGGCGGDVANSFISLKECLGTCKPFRVDEGPTCKQIFFGDDRGSSSSSASSSSSSSTSGSSASLASSAASSQYIDVNSLSDSQLTSLLLSQLPDDIVEN